MLNAKIRTAKNIIFDRYFFGEFYLSTQGEKHLPDFLTPHSFTPELEKKGNKIEFEMGVHW